MRSLIIVCFILSALTVVTAYLTRENTQSAVLQNDQRNKVNAPTIIPKAILSFSPDNLSLRYGQTGTVSLEVVYQGDKPDFAQLEIGFDPEVIGEITIAPGNFFETPSILLETIDEDNGRISFALRSTNAQPDADQKSDVLNIGFRVLSRSAGITNIYFLPKTKMSTNNADIELVKPEGLNIFIQSENESVITSPSI